MVGPPMSLKGPSSLPTAPLPPQVTWQTSGRLAVAYPKSEKYNSKLYSLEKIYGVHF